MCLPRAAHRIVDAGCDRTEYQIMDAKKTSPTQAAWSNVAAGQEKPPKVARGGAMRQLTTTRASALAAFRNVVKPESGIDLVDFAGPGSW